MYNDIMGIQYTLLYSCDMGMACWTRFIDDDDNIEAMGARAVSTIELFFSVAQDIIIMILKYCRCR